MNCTQVRHALMKAGPFGGSTPAGRHQDTAVHMRHCATCGRFAAKLQAARQGLRQHHAGIEPDTGFAERVGRSLDTGVPADLGRVALRLLPLSLAVLLLLFLISTQTKPLTEPAANITTTEDAYLTWVLAPDQENS